MSGTERYGMTTLRLCRRLSRRIGPELEQGRGRAFCARLAAATPEAAGAAAAAAAGGSL